MAATQRNNQRATSDKTYHLMLSFRPGETVADDVLKAIENRVCDALGYKDHQRVSVVHNDTDNLHVHIAINKIHPKKLTILEPHRDFVILAEICAKLEADYGLQVDNHQPQQTVSESKARDMERHAGVQSLIGYVRAECADSLKAATTWGEVHQALNAFGLQMVQKGNGLVIIDGEGQGVKASTIARELSKHQLEKKLGRYSDSNTDKPRPPSITANRAPPLAKIGKRPPPDRKGTQKTLSSLPHVQLDPSKRYQKSPFGFKVNTVELHAKYKYEQRIVQLQKPVALRELREQTKREMAEAQQRAKLKRGAIKGVKGAAKKLLLEAIKNTHNDTIKTILKNAERTRAQIDTEYGKKTWADWLRAQAIVGNQEALAALRAREITRALNPNTISATGYKAPSTSGTAYFL